MLQRNLFSCEGHRAVNPTSFIPVWSAMSTKRILHSHTFSNMQVVWGEVAGRACSLATESIGPYQCCKYSASLLICPN